MVAPMYLHMAREKVMNNTGNDTQREKKNTQKNNNNKTKQKKKKKKRKKKKTLERIRLYLHMIFDRICNQEINSSTSQIQKIQQVVVMVETASRKSAFLRHRTLRCKANRCRLLILTPAVRILTTGQSILYQPVYRFNESDL